MSRINKADATETTLVLLEQLAMFLMTEMGIGVTGARELMKIAYARAGRTLVPLRKDETVNYTAIAGITGLTRQEVPRLLENREGSQVWTLHRNQQRIQRIMDGWQREYRTKRGSPAVLHVRGVKHSFEELVKRYGSSERVETNLQMLLDAKAVELLPRERVRLIRRQFAAARMDTAMQAAFAAEIAEHIKAACHNVRHAPDEALFASRIESVDLDADPNILAMLKHTVAERGNAFNNALSLLLNDSLYQAKPDEPGRRLAFVSYLVEMEPDHSASPRPTAKHRRPTPRGQG